MWDLNDWPDVREEDECSSAKTSIEGEGDEEKGKRVGSLSNSSSSAVVMEEEEVEVEGGSDEEEPTPMVTRQFFPLEETEIPTPLPHASTTSAPPAAAAAFPRAHWVGVKFAHPDPLAALPNNSLTPTDLSHPIKKSRRGPRSRSSQYRGVTFYRRTGRWESHIWSASLFTLLFFFFNKKNTLFLSLSLSLYCNFCSQNPLLFLELCKQLN